MRPWKAILSRKQRYEVSRSCLVDLDNVGSVAGFDSLYEDWIERCVNSDIFRISISVNKCFILLGSAKG